MHRFSARTLTVLSLAGLLAAASLPALAKSSRPKQHRGKKAVGEIVSFDEATLTLEVDLAGDDDFTGAVDPDVQVKLDHRGWAKKGGSREGNPTKGSLDDLLPGTPVLRLKIEDDVVTKIRLRPTAEAPLPDTGDDEDALPGDDSTDDTSSDDTDTDDTDTDDGDTDTDDTDGDDADSNPDDDDLGDPGDALPPLPLPQP